MNQAKVTTLAGYVLSQILILWIIFNQKKVTDCSFKYNIPDPYKSSSIFQIILKPFDFLHFGRFLKASEDMENSSLFMEKGCAKVI